MVVGGGMMAQAFSPFRDDGRVVIFASGVSDSLEDRAEAFDRERKLLQRTRVENASKLLVYFGTCSVVDPDRRDTPYVQHKLEMESLLQNSEGPWMTLRLPLAIGPVHRTRTLAQYLYDRISAEESFEVWAHATRYPIDVADTFRIASHFLPQRALWNRRINLALRAFKITDFVRSLELIVGKTARYELVPKGQHYDLSCPEVMAVANQLELDLSEHYLDRVLRKYFRREPGVEKSLTS
jgi:hypothetical protein